MTIHASGTFDVSLEERERDERSGVRITHSRGTKSFQGDLEGDSVVDMIASGVRSAGWAAYVAVETLRGTLHGRTGGFVVQHTATMAGGVGSLTITVVPGSGTDDLAGITGTMGIEIVDGKHHYTLDYALDP
jgi:hypothetical protein